VSLVEDHIDKWEVNYTYPTNKEVTLRFDFHLKELLPPKITVVFPASIQYVCFQELGTNEWKNNNDIVTLIYSLQTEFNYRAQTRQEGKVLTPEEAQSQWKFVQGAHTDWGYVDVVELSKKIETVELDVLRKEGAVALQEISEPPAPQDSEQVAQNKDLVAENKEQVAENKEQVAENKEQAEQPPVPENKEPIVPPENQEPAVIENKEPIVPPENKQNAEQPPVPENKEPIVPPENQEPAVIENKEPIVPPENQEQAIIENKNENVELELVQEKKEILEKKIEEPVQENREDLLQENKEEIITN